MAKHSRILKYINVMTTFKRYVFKSIKTEKNYDIYSLLQMTENVSEYRLYLMNVQWRSIACNFRADYVFLQKFKKCVQLIPVKATTHSERAIQKIFKNIINSRRSCTTNSSYYTDLSNSDNLVFSPLEKR